MNALSALLPTHHLFVEAAATLHRGGDVSSQVNVPCPKCGHHGMFVRDRGFADGSGKVWVCPNESCESFNLYYYEPVFTDLVSKLQHRVAQFQLSHFATQTLDGKLAHLDREVDELRAQPDDLTEWADVLILLLGAAACRGLTVNDLVDAAQVKMNINDRRTWPTQPDAEGIYHHTSH